MFFTIYFIINIWEDHEENSIASSESQQEKIFKDIYRPIEFPNDQYANFFKDYSPKRLYAEDCIKYIAHTELCLQ